jgi:two-component system phosphate regulon sensor histidine kinase PhoR
MQPKQRSSTISKTQYDMQQSLSKRYLYERALFDEVIYKIMSQASNKPIEERVHFNRLEQYIRYELSYNGLNEPFSFQVVNFNNRAVYSSPGFTSRYKDAIYTQTLFPNDPPAKLNQLRV